MGGREKVIPAKSLYEEPIVQPRSSRSASELVGVCCIWTEFHCATSSEDVVIFWALQLDASKQGSHVKPEGTSIKCMETEPITGLFDIGALVIPLNITAPLNIAVTMRSHCVPVPALPQAGRDQRKFSNLSPQPSLRRYGSGQKLRIPLVTISRPGFRVAGCRRTKGARGSPLYPVPHGKISISW